MFSNRVEKSTRENIMEEQGGFMSDRGCIDQIYIEAAGRECREKKKEQ